MKSVELSTEHMSLHRQELLLYQMLELLVPLLSILWSLAVAVEGQVLEVVVVPVDSELMSVDIP
tara:strand:+ start:128 stop:319 length:192 start_codon:yes stop_codon:yes gene_type:complete